MAELKKIKSIPETLTLGKGKDKEVYIHYISLKSSKAATDTKNQVKSHFKKIHIEKYLLGEDKIYSIFIIKNE